MKEDLTSSEDLLGQGLPAEISLESEFIRPAFSFNGKPLWPYTEGVDLVLRQINHSEDNALTAALKFIFVLSRRGGATMEEDFMRYVIPLAWRGSDEIHLELFKWVQDNVKSTAAKLEAMNLVDKIKDAAEAGAVDIVPKPGGKKKAEGSSRPRPRSSSRSSLKTPVT
ncbi:MAG TPA: hypothetical protein VJS88_00395 [Chthoniobacterales bacterium]|nr:hypothetical protein [Chthoniobacterales bacterium]